MDKYFGEHLMIDGYGGKFDKLNNKEQVMGILVDLPISLGMNKLAPPVVYFAPGNNAKDPGGWSGFVVIAESHISIHTFPEKGFLSADVYTCKPGMDIENIKAIFIEKFDLKKIEENFVFRGLNYPF